MRIRVSLVLGLLMALVFGPPAYAQHGLAVPFDWISAWGTVNPWNDSKTPETGIPTKYHALKSSISTAIQRCGAQGTTDFHAFEVYTVNLSGSSFYLLDGYKFFPAQTHCVNQALEECIQGQGCYAGMGTLVASTVTETAPCENSSCAHTIYSSLGVWLDIVSGGQWSLISHQDFLTIRENNKDVSGQYKYLEAASAGNNGNVFVAQIGRPEVCTVDEMDQNNDGETDVSCTKYYQYDHGRMVDLYKPQATREVANPADANLFQSNAAPAPNVVEKGYDRSTVGSDGHGVPVAGGTDAFSRLPAKDMSGDVYDNGWRGVAHSDDMQAAGRASERLLANKVARAYEIRSQFEGLRMCAEFKNDGTNSGTNSVFIPTRRGDEFMSFVNAVLPNGVYGLEDLVGNLAPQGNQPWVTNGTVPGVSGRACERRYTKWVGPTSCSQVVVPCESTITITAERRCQRSSGEYGVCGECARLSREFDPEGVVQGAQTPCFFQAVCQGGACPVEPPKCDSCPPPPHNSCIGAESKALMVDGSYKKMRDIKVGDEVMGFKKDAPLATLVPTRVTKIMATPVPDAPRALYGVNGISMTAGHSVVLGNGKIVPASNIRKGDKLVGISGEPVKVLTRKKLPQSNTVYSVWFSDADGFVVDGVRMLGQ